MHFKLRLIPAATAAVLLVACGGGSNSAPPPSYTPTSGVAVDGYLKFAKVVCDTNGNGLGDAGEPVAYTLGGPADSGKFTFAQGCASHGLIVSGGTSADTGLMFVGLMKAPAGATVISPLTTLMVAGMTQAQVIATLGLSASTDLLHTDPVAQADKTLLKKTLAVQQLLQKITELFAGLGGMAGSAVMEPIYIDVAAAFAATLSSSAPLMTNGTDMDDEIVKALIQAAAQRVLASSTTSSAVKTALANINLAAMADVVDAALAYEAEAILLATDANLAAVTKAEQGDTYITDYVIFYKDELAGTPSPATIESLGATLLSDVVNDTSSIDTGAAGTVLLSFDEEPPAFTGMGAFGGALPSVAVYPEVGDTDKVLKIAKPAGAEAWGGIYFSTAAIPFTDSRKKISAQVYSTKANSVINFKVEVPGGTSVEIPSAPTGPANTWSTVTWDFSAVDSTKAYTVIAITPDAETATSDQSYYFDDITLLGDVPVTPGDYLYLKDNALSLSDGTTTTSYSMTQFQSTAGIDVKWPMVNTAALKLNLAENGSFALASGQTLEAAVSITQESPTGLGEASAYIENALVTKNGSVIQVTIPAVTNALVYGVSGDGKTKAIIDFADSVANVTNTLSTAANAVSTVVLGEVVNYAINGVSNDFTGMYGLTGKYKVKIVVTQLPLRQADGSAFPVLTVQVPTKIDSSGNGTNIVPVTGNGLEGYINLVK